MPGLLVACAPALITGFIIARIPLPGGVSFSLAWAALALLVGHRLLAPARGALGLAGGILLAQLGALSALSTEPSTPLPLESHLGRFEARAGRTRRQMPGGGRSVELHALRAAASQLELGGRSFLQVPDDGRDYPQGATLVLEGVLRSGDRGIRRLDARAELDIATTDPRENLATWRSRLAERLARHVADAAFPWLAALVLGISPDRAEMRELLNRSGAGHFFVVSGLHIGLVAVLVTRLAALCGVGRRRAELAAILPCAFYVMLTGGNPPALRALAIVLLVLLADRGGRPFEGLRLLVALAALALLWAPELFAEASFLYSFSAVAGILALAEPKAGADEVLRRFLRRKSRWRIMQGIRSSLRVSQSAFLATAPISLLLHGACAPIAIVASVLLLPLVTLMLILAVAGLITPLPEWPLEGLARSLTTLLSHLASWPGARIEIARADLPRVAPAWIGLLVGAYLRRCRNMRLAAPLAAWSGLGAALLLCSIGTPEPALEANLRSGSPGDADGSRAALPVLRIEGASTTLLLGNAAIALVADGERGRFLEVEEAPPEFFAVTWPEVDEVRFLRRMPTWTQLAVMERMRATRFRAPPGMSDEGRLALLRAGYLEVDAQDG